MSYLNILVKEGEIASIKVGACTSVGVMKMVELDKIHIVLKDKSSELILLESKSVWQSSKPEGDENHPAGKQLLMKCGIFTNEDINIKLNFYYQKQQYCKIITQELYKKFSRYIRDVEGDNKDVWDAFFIEETSLPPTPTTKKNFLDFIFNEAICEMAGVDPALRNGPISVNSLTAEEQERLIFT
jgi:hypothetical protein